uniref:EAL domain-containing protein n=1 Tax=Treponema sp. TaxID=166 RepID=UPI00388D723F
TYPDSPYFGKVFIPETEKYSHITSEIISAATESGIVEVENYLREPIDLIYTKIKNCGWTLAVGFPKKYLDKIYNQQRIIKFLILIISVVALSFLMLLELSISDYFYKNQLIEADYNSISNLWTRQKFEKEAQKLLEHHPHSRFMMIESDIKGFKFVNQSYGEESANNMLFFYSKIINKISLEFNGIVGHGYADHFYSLIQVHDLRAAMYKFREKMKEVDDFIKEYEIPFFPKFGVTFCKPSRTPDITIKELIGQTSFVKSTVKDNMMVPYSVYNFTLLNKLKEEQLIESRMESALQNEEFFLMYQPKISLKTDKIVGAEALVRWKTSDSGMFMPDKFIPLFEKNGFIIKLDFYVYEQVFKFIDSQLKAGKKVVPVSVNMSRNHSKPERFMETFMSLFRKYEIPPHLIQIEIIERSFMDSETLCDITNRLHREGFTVAMDDFGIGESSLNMLTKVPVDVLKFDREFLISSTRNDGEMDEKSANFITSLINLSRQLEKETVFEGVETVIQRDFLRKINCDQVQGYFYSRPLLEKDFVEFMNIHL